MCSNENSERTIKTHQNQFRVTNLSEKLSLTNQINQLSGCNNKSVYHQLPSQCPKSPSELSSRISSTPSTPSLTSSTTATTSLISSTTSSLTSLASSLSQGIPQGGSLRPAHAVAAMSSMLGNSVLPPGLIPPLDHYRLQLYNYAMVERLRCSQYPGPLSICPPGYPSAAAAVNNPYGPRFALSMSLFHNRVFQPEEPKPQHSYIGLIAMAILSSPESKLVLSDIYQHILDNYPYFRTRGPGWRNSIRHNLSLNDCFIKAGRSANGKGHYWAIHPANLEDFKKGDFRRRKAQRKVRKHMGLAVDDEGTDSPSPPPLSVTPPSHNTQNIVGPTFCPTSWVAAAAVASGRQSSSGVMANIYSQSRKRQFDVASLLAPDDNDNSNDNRFINQQNQYHQNFDTEQQCIKIKKQTITNSDIDEDIDVVASDDPEDISIQNNNLNQIIDQHDDDDIQKIDQKYHQNHQNDHQNDNQNHQQYHQQHHQQQNNINLIHQQDNIYQINQHEQDQTSTLSPNSQQDDEIQINCNSSAASPSPNSITGGCNSSSGPWQGLIQQWPNNFVGTAMDPRILGRYYGQYMAAAAAQQAAVARHSAAAAAVGNFLNGTPSPRNGANHGNCGHTGGGHSSSTCIGDSTNCDSSDSQHHQSNNHQHKIQNDVNPPVNEC